MPRSPASRSTSFFELIPPRAAFVFFAAIFFIFAPVNLLLTSSLERSGPLGAGLLLAVLSGATAVCWAATFTVSGRFAFGIVPFMLAVMLLSGPLSLRVLGVRPTPPSPAGLAVVGAIVLGYVLFIVFINGQGRTTLRLLTEMALAQRIHASLVPALLRSDERLEVDGASFASTEMGGDLVDMLDHGTTTDLVLADVSGHGVKAGVVMGLLKAAIRMGLREDRGLEHLAGALSLAPGDLIATWTDGLDETVNGTDQELGRAAIESAIVARAERPLAEIRSAVFELARAHGPQKDDRSLLLVRVQ